jgi:hypothetical protein
MRLVSFLPTLLFASFSLHLVAPPVPGAGPGNGLFDAGNFRFGSGARSSLQALWQASSDAKAERVACIGGYRHGGITYITRVVQVTAYAADSLHATASASLRECGPPEWLGTVHTHIARINGQPYTTFSAGDRWVMEQWHQTWRAEGVFCVLYDDRRAYCEAGDESSGDAFYAYARGNNLIE